MLILYFASMYNGKLRILKKHVKAFCVELIITGNDLLKYFGGRH